MKVTHLHKYGSGFTSKTACGRSLLRTPFSTKWEEFKTDSYKCIKCESSKQADLFRRIDLKNV